MAEFLGRQELSTLSRIASKKAADADPREARKYTVFADRFQELTGMDKPGLEAEYLRSLEEYTSGRSIRHRYTHNKVGRAVHDQIWLESSWRLVASMMSIGYTHAEDIFPEFQKRVA